MSCPTCGVPEWVSVNDKLPERGVSVLVLEKAHETTGTTRTSVMHIPHYRDGTYAGDDGKSWYPGGLGVGWTTHWMHIPDAPEP